MTVQYISLEEILRLHFQLIEDFGGSHGVRDEGRLKSVVHALRQEAYGNEQYVTVFEKAAVYLRNIVGDHPFVDGNKRTAVTVCSIFLIRNGRKISAPPNDLELFTIAVATEHMEIAEIANWLECNTVPYSY